jgi:hypothetical protein
MAERVRASYRSGSIDNAARNCGFRRPGTKASGTHVFWVGRLAGFLRLGRLDSSNLAAKPRITIVSGSATAIEPGRFSVPIDYRMTTIPITATVFAKFVMSAFKAKPDEIALLSEANTAYGRSFGREQRTLRPQLERLSRVLQKPGLPSRIYIFPCISPICVARGRNDPRSAGFHRP